MPIQREFIFVGNICYNINSTMSYMENLYRNEGVLPQHRYETIMVILSDFKFPETCLHYEYMEDVNDGILWPTDQWLMRYGIEEPASRWVSEFDDDTIGTFDMTVSDWDSEECIESDDEEELVMGAYILADMVREDNEERGLVPAVDANFLQNMGLEMEVPDNDGTVTDDWGVGSVQTDGTDQSVEYGDI